MKNPSVSQHLSLTPFLEHNDGNRLQMSHSQVRQTVPLFHGEPPRVVTGVEPLILSFTRKSSWNGVVLFVHRNFILVKDTDEDKYRIFRVSSKDIPVVSPGQTIKKGDLLCVPEGFYAIGTNGLVLTYGVNLYTSIMNHPLSFEDAYVVSSNTEKRLMSYLPKVLTVVLRDNEFLVPIDPNKQKWHPEIRSFIPRNTPVFIIMNTEIDEKKIIEFPFDIILEHVEIIPNSRIPQHLPGMFRGFLAHQLTKRQLIKEEIAEQCEGDKNIEFLVSAFLGLEGNLVNRNKEWSCVIRIYYKQVQSKLELGDKVTNRHAGKGVISLVVDAQNMPFNYPDYVGTDIILNPMSIISRMNLGTLFELVASRIVMWFQEKVRYMLLIEQRPVDEVKEFILDFYSKVDKSSTKFVLKNLKSLLDTISRKPVENQVKLLSVIEWTFPAPPFQSVTWKELQELALEYVPPVPIPRGYVQNLLTNDEMPNSLSRLGNRLWLEPTTHFTQLFEFAVGKTIRDWWDEMNIPHTENEEYVFLHPFLSLSFVPWIKSKFPPHVILNSGFLYYLKLIHMSSLKLSSRSVGKMSSKHMSPTKSKKNFIMTDSLVDHNLDFGMDLLFDVDEENQDVFSIDDVTPVRLIEEIDTSTLEEGGFPELKSQKMISVVQSGGVLLNSAQRVGEMETINLIAYDCVEYLQDLLTLYSDDVIGKLNTVLQLMFSPNPNLKIKRLTRETAALETIMSYLKLFDIDL